MKAAIWLVKLYPSAWRRRYEAEMLAVLEEHHVTVLTILDLLFGVIAARLDPNYRTEPGRIAFATPRAATQVFLAACGIFLLFTQMSIVIINEGVARLFPSNNVMFLGPIGDITSDPGKVDIDVLGSSLWYYERITAYVCVAITALVICAALAWAVTTRRVWFVLLTAVVFAAPVAAVIW